MFIASTLQIAASLEVMLPLEPRSDSQAHLIYTLMCVRLWGRNKEIQYSFGEHNSEFYLFYFFYEFKNITIETLKDSQFSLENRR